jgi:DNA repair photolyase
VNQRFKIDRHNADPAPNSADGLLTTTIGGERRRGRGAVSNSSGRFEPSARIPFDDGWQSLDDLPSFKTVEREERARKIITRNQSPDLGFDRSINPYRGCEHGCIYCFARPTHAYHGMSAGLDFETQLFVKPDAPELLRKELAAPGYIPRTIAMGTNTDPYQPIERKWKLTRRILEVLRDANHPVGIVTKSILVLRDLDILSEMAAKGLAKVALSVTTLDPKLARAMEPRASTPAKRLEAIRELSRAGVPAAIMTAPIVPAINDSEIERLLDAGAASGAVEAGFVMLKMPFEIKDLFREWLREHFPDKEKHVISLIRDIHGGKDYDPTWGTRQAGTGPYAWSVGRRFEIACNKLGLNRRSYRLTTAHFKRPAMRGGQMDLFAA